MVDDEGDDEDPKDLKNLMESSQCVWVLLTCISWDNTLITGNSEKQPLSIEFTRWIV
jgi:hypothetical protein